READLQRGDEPRDPRARPRGVAARDLRAMVKGSQARAVRAVLTVDGGDASFLDAVRRKARELGVLGWLRGEDDGSVAVHAEGPAAAIEALLAFLREGAAAARGS